MRPTGGTRMMSALAWEPREEPMPIQTAIVAELACPCATGADQPSTIAMELQR